MKRLWKPLLCLLLAALTLSGCSGQPSNTEQFPEVTQALGPATPTPEPIVLDSQDDPSAADGRRRFRRGGPFRPAEHLSIPTPTTWCWRTVLPSRTP